MIYQGLTEKTPTWFDPGVSERLSYYDIFSNYEEYVEDQLARAEERFKASYLRFKIISEWIEPNSSVLDVGCGIPYMMEFLSKIKNCKVVGMDVSNKAIELVRSKGFEGFVRNVDGKDLGLAIDEKYDYILFIEVLEHLGFPHIPLIDACKCAKKGVIVSFPNTGYFWYRLQLLRGYVPRQEFTHVRFWSINDFQIFLNYFNLKPLALKTNLTTQGIKGFICNHLKNLLASKQFWLIEPLIESE